MAPHKRGAQKKRATLLFVDESGLCVKPSIRRTWAPVGCTPRIVHRTNWTKLSAISAVSRTGSVYFKLHKGAIKTAEVLDFLRHLLRHTSRPLVIVWDNVGPHKSKAVQQFVASEKRLEVHYLPPYCPEFNPDEWFWARLKSHELVGFAPDDLAELKRGIRLAVVRMRRKPWIIRSFYRASRLAEVA